VVRKPVVVLDEVQARERQRAAERRRLPDRKPYGLEDRRGDRAAVHAEQAPEPRDAEPRPAKDGRERARKADVLELDVGLQGAVAEEHVEELRRVVRRGGPRLRQGDPVVVRLEWLDRHNAPDHVLAHERRAQRGPRELDRLLQKERLDPDVNVRRGRAHAVDHFDCVSGHLDLRYTSRARQEAEMPVLTVSYFALVPGSSLPPCV